MQNNNGSAWLTVSVDVNFHMYHGLPVTIKFNDRYTAASVK